MSKRSLNLHCLLVAALLGTEHSGFAKDFRIVQANKNFVGDVDDEQAKKMTDDLSLAKSKRIEEFHLKVGDQLIFANRDYATHNINGTLNGDKLFDVGEQPPGKTNDRVIKIEKKGEISIQCAIHPKMKLKLTAE
jgi:plastocyanin